MSWQNKYRPTKISELHLTKVREQMNKYLQQGKLPQVLLFAGPKGTGKTSTARIVAALLNSPSNDAAVQEIYFDKKGTTVVLNEPDVTDDEIVKIFQGDSFAVVEMDAASNRRIEDVRLLQERIHLPSSISKMTVYILDEAHMFTTEAFNALLKILEEPPSHCVFILATTEKHKIPATVLSRCTTIDFMKATPTELISAFIKVLDQEKISYAEEALVLLASQMDGSFRDGIKTLEAASLLGCVTCASVDEALGVNVNEQVLELVNLIIAKDLDKLASFFKSLRASGISESYFYKNLLTFLHEQWLIGLGVEAGKPCLTTVQAVFLLKALREVEINVSLNFLSLELCIFDIVDKASKKKGSK